MYKVVLVDDEPFILDGLYDALDWSSYGLELTGRAENGQEALELLKKVPADILITDITMPRMNGLELIRAVRGFRPELKVIILSGYNEFDYLKEGMQLGIENYLLKPINFAELSATLTGTVEKLNLPAPLPPFHESEMDILKDNVLNRWLSGRISRLELEERAKLLGIRLEGTDMIAVVIRAAGPPDDLLYAEVQRRIGPEPDAECYVNMEGDIVAVFLADGPEACKRNALAFADALRKAVPGAQGIRISLGSPGRLFLEEPRSYEEALRAQEYFLLLPPDGIADYGELRNGVEGGPDAFRPDWPAYARLLMAKDREGLIGRIGTDFAALHGREGVTPGFMRSLAVELAVRMKLELGRVRMPDAVEERFKDVLERITRSTSREQLLETLEEMAGMAVGGLVQEDKSPVIKQILNHIHRCYAQDMSLKSLGQQYNIHPVYLGQLFHKETREVFTEYINKYRIEMAKAQLKETNLKVHEIAKQVGYWETGYFHKQFKKYVGISPMEYRGLL